MAVRRGRRWRWQGLSVAEWAALTDASITDFGGTERIALAGVWSRCRRWRRRWPLGVGDVEQRIGVSCLQTGESSPCRCVKHFLQDCRGLLAGVCLQNESCRARDMGACHGCATLHIYDRVCADPQRPDVTAWSPDVSARTIIREGRPRVVFSSGANSDGTWHKCRREVAGISVAVPAGHHHNHPRVHRSINRICHCLLIPGAAQAHGCHCRTRGVGRQPIQGIVTPGPLSTPLVAQDFDRLHCCGWSHTIVHTCCGPGAMCAMTLTIIGASCA